MAKNLHLTSLFLIALAMAGCVTKNAQREHTDAVQQAAGCTTEVPDDQLVVGCRFGPGTTPIALGDGRLYVVSGVGTYSAIDLATATVTRLYREYQSRTTEERALGVVLHDQRLYFPGWVASDGFFEQALLSIDGTSPTPADEPDVVALPDEYQLHGPMVGDDEWLYARSTTSEEFSSFAGPVVAIRYDGTGVHPRTLEDGQPIGVADGTVYYMHGHDAKRIATPQAPASLVASSLSAASYVDRAVDANHLYATTSTAPYELRRFDANGASTLVGTASAGDPEVQLGPPHHLRIDGNWLYYLQDRGEHYTALLRVPADGSGAPESVASGQDLAAPVFDATGVYTTYTRGGGDEPIEAVVVRIAK